MKQNEQMKSELISYIKKNKRDYYTIFKSFDCQNYKTFYYNFIDFYNALKNGENLENEEIQTKMTELKELFHKIKKSVVLNKHQEICVLSMGVYLSLFLNMEIENNGENIINSCDSEDYDDPLDLFDNTNFEKINDKLKIAHKQIGILINIMKQLKKECSDKINDFAVSRGDSHIENINVDYINKIILIAYKQIESLVTKNNCIFNGLDDTCPIKIYSENGKSSTLCIIDNFKINLHEEEKKKYINIKVANINYKIYLIKHKITYFEGVDILKNIMKSLKNITISLESNKKMINYWLNISKNNETCKI